MHDVPAGSCSLSRIVRQQQGRREKPGHGASEAQFPAMCLRHRLDNRQPETGAVGRDTGVARKPGTGIGQHRAEQ